MGETGTAAGSTTRLVWGRFRQSRTGIAGLTVLAALYLAALFADPVAPYDPSRDDLERRNVPPQRIRILDGGRPRLPFVYGLTTALDPDTLERVHVPDRAARHPVRLFHRGDPYRLFGLLPLRVHLIGSDGPMHLLGTDRMGRDVLSRIVHGGRISLTVGLAGVLLAVVLGSILGAVSAWFGGVVDGTVQRLIELLSSFPSVPLWMALAAALPPTWPPLRVYFAITVILSLLGWGGLARQVRGKLLAVRDADYVHAARAAGAGSFYVLRRHLLPAATSHVLVVATLAVPGMILGETALSFLGLGIRPPLVSWGVLLEEAQRVTVVLHYPWLLFPAAAVTLAVVAFNLVGDALRDAADPWR